MILYLYLSPPGNTYVKVVYMGKSRDERDKIL